MTRPATSRLPFPVRPKVLVAVGVVAGALAMASVAGANQVYKACGKKWARKAAKLETEQLAWMMKRSSAEILRDVDGDGREDRIVMTSTPSFRTCEVREDWDRKENTIRIEYAGGRVRLFHWINTQLVETMTHYPQIGRILVAGVDAEGHAVSKWVDYGEDAGAPQPALLAAAPAATARNGPIE